MNRLQLITAGAGKFGVEGQHLYREFDLVDDALARAVPTREKFEIYNFIKRFVSVHMVNCLIGMKPSPEVLFHHIPVLENVSRRFSVFTRDDQSNIAVARNALRGLLIRVVSLVGQPAKLRSAFGAAEALSAIYGSAGSALNVHTLSALNASSVPCFFRQSSAQSSTFGRTVHRFLIPLFSIRSNGSGFVLKRRAANLAIKLRALDASVFATENRFVRFLARKSTEFLGGISRLYPEGLTAAFANFLNRHLCFSCVVGTSGYSTVCRLSKQEI